MRIWEVCLFIVLLALGAASARAGVLTAPAEDLEVSLVTYGPGAIYWERFGHNAIRIRDRVSGESVDFNYGVFDFEDRTFLWNFARGHMRYMIDAEYSDVNQQDYIDAGRSVLEQRLALSAEQAAKLRDFLIWNLQPENLEYEYDYLTSNCSTRIRDALNSVLGGVLEPALAKRSAPLTYRQQIDRLMAAQPLMMLPMDLGMGPSTDRPLNEWEESFLPMVLAREIRTVLIPDGHGGVEPMVASEREISPNRLEPPGESPPNFALQPGWCGPGARDRNAHFEAPISNSLCLAWRSPIWCRPGWSEPSCSRFGHSQPIMPGGAMRTCSSLIHSHSCYSPPHGRAAEAR